MRRFPFGSFQAIQKNLNGRSIVLFGAGAISTKTARKINHEYEFIVDNNPNCWNISQEGKEVLNPSVLKEKQKQYYVVICTTSFAEVATQLEKEFGFVSEEDFMVSPVLNDLRIISEIEHHKTKLLFTSGVPEEDDPRSGGGIYELTLEGHDYSYKKVYSGICYGLIHYKGNIISFDDKKGIIELDRDYNIIRSQELPLATRGHGVAYSESTHSFYIAASYKDSVIVLDESFQQTGEIKLSNKLEHEGAPAHHCNDLCIVDNSLYISMFSHSGNWKKDIFDGAVLEIDLMTQTVRGPVIQNLWMPHNIMFLDGSLVVLDSLRGELRKNNAQAVGKFPAFTRGLDFDGVYFYIGQSRNRNFSKNIGLSLNIAIDTGIVIFDETTKVSRTLQLPQKLSEIHAILCLD